MKQSRVFRTLAIVIIMSLLTVAIPATTVLALPVITLDPDRGPPGTLVTVSATGFSPGLYVEIAWEDTGKDWLWVEATGTFTASFTVPNVDRGTYTVRVVNYDTGFPVTSTTFTVTGIAEIEIDPEEGPVGTEVEISGEGFEDREDILIEYDGDEVDIEEGDDQADSDGEFQDTIIIIPESTAGEHTITVTGDDSDIEAEATFTVEPEITISPTSGASGIEVKVTGTGFGRRKDVTIFFNDGRMVEERTIREGSFTATFILPPIAPGTYNIEAKDEDGNSEKAKFTIAGEISISPTSGNIGSAVTVTGTGFKAGSPVDITYDNIRVKTATTDAGGNFSATFNVPPSTKGTHTITASAGLTTKSATFEVLTSGSINYTTGSVGSELTISGNGFSGQVTIKYDDDKIATTTADASGAFSANFPVPVSTKGDHTITASDAAGNTITQTFTMESEAPPAPKLLTPEPDAKVKAETTFDWEDADDVSLPVTYIFQIATSEDFDKNSIVLDEAELTKSKYTLTKAEELEPVKKEAPYYWRVKATDAASNEGDWSTPRAFTTGSAFAMTGWVLYLVIALGALLLFIFGMWVGRRTAYY